jgi:hypothetical protein
MREASTSKETLEISIQDIHRFSNQSMTPHQSPKAIAYQGWNTLKNYWANFLPSKEIGC